MNGPLGRRIKCKGMAASANAFSYLCSYCVYICGKGKKVNLELEMSRVGKGFGKSKGKIP